MVDCYVEMVYYLRCTLSSHSHIVVSSKCGIAWIIVFSSLHTVNMVNTTDIRSVETFTKMITVLLILILTFFKRYDLLDYNVSKMLITKLVELWVLLPLILNYF